jgi:nucleoid-associated protein YgaU
MRKDVQFGLTIGAMLVVVLVAWLSYINHSRQIMQPQGVALQQPDASTVADAATQPSTQPSENSVAIDTVTPTVTPTAAPQTRPSSVANVDSDNLHDWNQLLENGSSSGPVATTDTPATQPTEMLAAAEFPMHETAATTQPTSSAAATSSEAAPHTHVVKSGESLCSIAASVYGDASQYSRIEDANPKVNPNKLRIGTVLVIPDAQDGDKPTREDSTPAPTARAQVDSSKSYRVQSSDTLVAISRKLYGSSSEWEKIYDANRDTIGSNPGRLKVDTVLRLPAPPTLTVAAN